MEEREPTVADEIKMDGTAFNTRCEGCHGARQCGFRSYDVRTGLWLCSMCKSDPSLVVHPVQFDGDAGIGSGLRKDNTPEPITP